MRLALSLVLSIIITLVAWKEMNRISVKAMFFFGQFSIFFHSLGDFGIE